MHRPPPGRTISVRTLGEPFKAFVPAPLPPMPPIEWSVGSRRRFDDALVPLDHPRGQGKAPGEFRRTQVWPGGTRPGNAAFGPHWPTCNSKPSTPFWMATAAPAAC